MVGVSSLKFILYIYHEIISVVTCLVDAFEYVHIAAILAYLVEKLSPL
jgi:hypothetical protein